MSQKAVFFDRDGTLIREAHYLSKLEDIELLPGAVECLGALKQAGYFLGLVTNQSGVARGYFPEAFVYEAYQHIQSLLEPQGAALDALAYCPHHVKGTVEPYNVSCRCRKPEPGMIERLAFEHDLDLHGSWMFGDKLCDVELAANAGALPGLVLTGYGAEERDEVLRRFPQTQVAQDLFEVRQLVLGG